MDISNNEMDNKFQLSVYFVFNNLRENVLCIQKKFGF